MGVEGGADFFDVCAVRSDGVVKLFAGDAKLVSPVGDVRGELGIDLFGVVGSLEVLFVDGVGLVFFGLLLVFDSVVFGHAFSLSGAS